MVSLTTHRCSSKSSIMYSWFALSMLTMIDFTAGSHSIRTPAGVQNPGVSGVTTETGDYGAGRRRTSDSSGHGSWGNRPVVGRGVLVLGGAVVVVWFGRAGEDRRRRSSQGWWSGRWYVTRRRSGLIPTAARQKLRPKLWRAEISPRNLCIPYPEGINRCFSHMHVP